MTRAQYDPFQAVYHTSPTTSWHASTRCRAPPAARSAWYRSCCFAQSFSEEAFAGYLDRTRKGKQLVVRLPAEDDPMLQRVRMLRERDHLFVDTLQEYYRDFSDEMYGPYQEWRKLSYEEVIAYQELKAESRGS
jgi:hypothetical protein